MSSTNDYAADCQPEEALVRAFSIHEYRERIGKLRASLEGLNIDVYIGSAPENINYFTGFDPLGLYFYQQIFFTPMMTEPSLLTHRCERDLAYTQCWIKDIHIWHHGDDPMAVTLAMLRKLGVKSGSRVGLEMGNWYLKASTYKTLCETFPEVTFVDITDAVLRLRTIKSPTEVARMRAAAAFSDVGFSAAAEALRPGVREIDVLAAVQSAMTIAGSEYPTLPFIIGSGPRSGQFHSVPTDRIIQTGDPVMMEITGVCGRYNSNIVRTVVVGSASPFLKDLWSIVNDAFWMPFEHIRPGVCVSEIDQMSRQVRSKYLDCIPARAGFGMGLGYPPIWASRPNILLGDDEILEEGMIFSLEPSIAQYKGVTVIFGYNVLVTENGAEILQRTPRGVFELLS